MGWCAGLGLFWELESLKVALMDRVYSFGVYCRCGQVCEQKGPMKDFNG